MKQIQAVTFDVGGTLIEPWPSVGHVYAEVAARHGLDSIPPDRLNQNFSNAWRAMKAFYHTRADWAEIVDRTFADFCPTERTRGFFPELFDRFAQPAAWRVFEDTLPALEELSRLGVRLGIISNWDERLRGLLKGLGLDRYFQSVVISCEIGAAKPAAAIFSAAAGQLQLPPTRILHIGDSLEADVEGARAVGFEARRIRRSRPLEEKSDIARLTEVLTIIGRHRAKSDKGA